MTIQSDLITLKCVKYGHCATCSAFQKDVAPGEFIHWQLQLDHLSPSIGEEKSGDRFHSNGLPETLVHNVAAGITDARCHIQLVSAALFHLVFLNTQEKIISARRKALSVDQTQAETFFMSPDDTRIWNSGCMNVASNLHVCSQFLIPVVQVNFDLCVVPQVLSGSAKEGLCSRIVDRVKFSMYRLSYSGIFFQEESFLLSV